MSRLFTHPDAWSGGFYELSIKVNDAGSIRQALAMLWSVSHLDGCYARREFEIDQQERLQPSQIPTEGHVFGVARFPQGNVCACGSYTASFRDAGTWISLYLPLGSVARILPIDGYPFGTITLAIRQSLQQMADWLYKVAIEFYQRYHFPFATIGFETEFDTVWEQAAIQLPIERWDGILQERDAQLQWYPPTIYT